MIGPTIQRPPGHIVLGTQVRPFEQITGVQIRFWTEDWHDFATDCSNHCRQRKGILAAVLAPKIPIQFAIAITQPMGSSLDGPSFPPTFGAFWRFRIFRMKKSGGWRPIYIGVVRRIHVAIWQKDVFPPREKGRTKMTRFKTSTAVLVAIVLGLGAEKAGRRHHLECRRGL